MDKIQRINEPQRLQRLTTALPAVDQAALAIERQDLQQVRIDPAISRTGPVVMPEDTSAAASSYRMLRAQVLRLVRAHNMRCIGVVSAVDGEGKTLTAVNLALSIAADPNQTVLLVDLDWRRPNIAALLGLLVLRGLDGWIAGTAEEHEICYAVKGMERLFIVPTLTAVPNSSAALADARTRELLAEMKEGRFNALPNRLVILDLPPALLTDEFLTIAPLLDGVLVVAREGYSKRDDLRRVQELLGSTRLVGTVLNDSSQAERRAY